MFTDAERAALELTEQGTRIADAAAASRTRPGRTPPSTTTRTSSPPWCPSSPLSTPSTARTSSSGSPPATTSRASSDNEEYLEAGGSRDRLMHAFLHTVAVVAAASWLSLRPCCPPRVPPGGGRTSSWRSAWRPGTWAACSSPSRCSRC
ncbi:hypothetical protein ACFQX6_31780 [Streptosporangium lutulentum]